MVTVIGLGFVGLTTALGLCEFGEVVYGIEKNESRLEMIKNGKCPFLEPHLEEKLKEYSGSRFLADRDLAEAVKMSDAVFVCVGTPYGDKGCADLTYVYSFIDEVLPHIRDGRFRTIVIKSTVPPSTISGKVIPYLEKKGVKVPEEIGVASNPEFLREGFCWEDFTNPGRIVIGTQDERSEEILRHVYRNSGCPVISVSYNTSEFIKYLSNSSLACLISFANEMSLAADAVGGIDIAKAFDVVRMDNRWQSGSIRSYLYPGCGYGGYCLPKDTNALYSAVKENGYDCAMLREVIRINDRMPEEVAKKIVKAADAEQPAEPVIGVLGLSFKVGSDDVRDSSAAKIIRSLNEMGYRKIAAYDPCAMEGFRKAYPDLECAYAENAEEVIKASDVLALVTPWDEFRDVKKYGKKVIDCRYALK